MSNKSLISEKDDFILNIEGFEGPIELLLDLAKNQKVDLKYISILGHSLGGIYARCLAKSILPILKDKNIIPKALKLDFKFKICLVEIINEAKIQN